MALTFTLDLEDHRPGPAHPPRFPDVTRDVLDRLDAAQVRGTFFVVGTVGGSDLPKQQEQLGDDVADRFDYVFATAASLRLYGAQPPLEHHQMASLLDGHAQASGASVCRV